MRYLLYAMLVSACAHPPRAKRGLHEDEDAILAFQRAWARDVRPHIGDPLVRRIDTRMDATATVLGRYVAEQLECREGIRRIEGLERIRATTPNAPAIVIHGSVDALVGRDRCWSVIFLGGMPNLDAEGWLDSSGRLLIAWRIPG